MSVFWHFYLKTCLTEVPLLLLNLTVGRQLYKIAKEG